MLYVRSLELFEQRHLNAMADGPRGYQTVLVAGQLPRRNQGQMSLRARIVLLSSAGKSVTAISSVLSKSQKTIRKWINLFNEGGIQGLHEMICRKVPYERKTDQRSLISMLEDLAAVGSGSWRLEGENWIPVAAVDNT